MCISNFYLYSIRKICIRNLQYKSQWKIPTYIEYQYEVYIYITNVKIT